MEPLVLNCNVAGHDLMKKASFELRSTDNNKTFQLYLPNANKFCVFETRDIGYFSYKVTPNDHETMYLNVKRKSKEAELLHEIVHYFRNFVETTLDNKLGFANSTKGYLGFGDKKVSFLIDAAIAKTLKAKKLRFKWTIETKNHNGIIGVQLRVLSVDQD